MKPARWSLPDLPPGETADLVRQLSITPPAGRVLWNRGYRDVSSAREYLDASVEALHDPFLLKDMQIAADRLVKAVHNGERILLYGDYDADGSTSVVILKTAIELAGGKAAFHVPDRFGEGYGMRPDVIERAAADKVSLVISVDTGIRAREAVERAVELGVDVIITDHHLPEESLPPALAIVNPNRLDCKYPDKGLCGAGVALKLIQAMFHRLEWSAARIRQLTLSLLKMVAIATVADVVPLAGENRIIVKHGLDGLRAVRSPGLRALLDVAGFNEGDRPTAGQVAFRIAPRINAAGRMAHATKVIKLFLARDVSEAHDLATQLQELNQERQQTEASLVNEILAGCERQPVTESQAALVFEGVGWHRGVVGIVATRLVERFHRPVFVLSTDPETGLAQGSGRSIRPFHLLEALESMAELFTRFGGHRQAAGCTLPVERVAEFRRRMEEYAGSRLTPEDFRPRIEIDSSLGLEELTDRSAADILSLEPFGFGNPTPVFAVRGATVAGQLSVFKEKHVRIPVRQNGKVYRVKGWHFAERAHELVPGMQVDLALSVEKDAYAAARGYPGWGLVLRDLRPAR